MLNDFVGIPVAAVARFVKTVRWAASRHQDTHEANSIPAGMEPFPVADRWSV